MNKVIWRNVTAKQITYKIEGTMGAWELFIKNQITGEWDHEVTCRTVADCNYHKACFIRRAHGMDGCFDNELATTYRDFNIDISQPPIEEGPIVLG